MNHTQQVFQIGKFCKFTNKLVNCLCVCTNLSIQLILSWSLLVKYFYSSITKDFQKKWLIRFGAQKNLSFFSVLRPSPKSSFKWLIRMWTFANKYWRPLRSLIKEYFRLETKWGLKYLFLVTYNSLPCLIKIHFRTLPNCWTKTCHPQAIDKKVSQLLVWVLVHDI